MPTEINQANQTITQYNVQTGAANNLLNQVAPGSTSGVPLISQGASAQPVFGTATVPGGGTGAVSLTGVLIGNGTNPVTGNPVTQHDVLVGGASNAITSVTPGVAGLILTSNGVSADPSFQPSNIGTVWISTTGASAGDYIITLPGTYTAYYITLLGLFPNTNGDVTQMFVSLDGGSTYLGTYQGGVTSFPYNSATAANLNSTTSAYLSGTVHSSGVGNGVTGSLLLNFRGGGEYVGSCTYCDTSAANARSMATFGGTISGVVTVPTTIKITSPTTGQLTFGFVNLYGLYQNPLP